MTGSDQPVQSEGDGQPERLPDLVRVVSGLANSVQKGIAVLVAPHDLSTLDVQLLMICREMRECAATQLAQLLPTDASRISRLVTELANKGLLRRRRLRSDRRIVMLRLSPAGEELMEELIQQIEEYYKTLTAGLSEREQRAFLAASLKIVSNYEGTQE